MLLRNARRLLLPAAALLLAGALGACAVYPAGSYSYYGYPYGYYGPGYAYAPAVRVGW